MKRGKYTEGANFTALREIKLLNELKHENIIEVSTPELQTTIVVVKCLIVYASCPYWVLMFALLKYDVSRAETGSEGW